MAKKAQGSIKLLLEAEAAASDKIREAKMQRTQKLKKAQEDAEKDIEILKAKMEEEFQKYKDSHLGSTTELEDKLTQKKNEAIAAINKAVSEKRDEVLDLLLKYVVSVKTD